MPNFKFNSRFNSSYQCIVYLDHCKKINDCIYNVYVDFRLKKDLNYYINSNQRNQSFGEIKTYLELKSLKTNKRLIQGSHYRLNLDVLNKISFVQNEESLFIGRTYEFEKMSQPECEEQEILLSHTDWN